MLKSTLAVGTLALTLLVIGPRAAEAAGSSANTLEPAINGQVSASGLFPTQEIEDQFNDYLAWTKAAGLSRLVAYEPRAGGEDVLPDQRMRQAFEDYLTWAVETDRGLYYAFTTRNFD
jgi:hypothetical protein